MRIRRRPLWCRAGPGSAATDGSIAIRSSENARAVCHTQRSRRAMSVDAPKRWTHSGRAEPRLLAKVPANAPGWVRRRECFGRETRYTHRVYGGVIINTGR
jgi:hypothetical protein